MVPGAQLDLETSVESYGQVLFNGCGRSGPKWIKVDENGHMNKMGS